MKKVKIAIAGCTGSVGRTFIRVLEERRFPVSEAVMFASAKSAGGEIEFCGQRIVVKELTEAAVRDNPVDIVLMSAGGSVSKVFAPIFASTGAVVIDNSSCWRMDENVPLVVPEVNPEDAFNHKGIIANPNCSTIQAVVALKPLDDAFKIKRIVYSTYQAVSGAGVAGTEDLLGGQNGLPPQKFPRPIYNNVIPQIDVFLENGYTKEEEKMIAETKKILHNKDLKVTATTARVPVFNGHSESVNVEFFHPAPVKKIKEILSKAPGVILTDEHDFSSYPTALDCDGADEVFVGRVRQDFSVDSGINFWVVADNVRKGAATNAVQIAELLVRPNV